MFSVSYYELSCFEHTCFWWIYVLTSLMYISRSRIILSQDRCMFILSRCCQFSKVVKSIDTLSSAMIKLSTLELSIFWTLTMLVCAMGYPYDFNWYFPDEWWWHFFYMAIWTPSLWNVYSNLFLIFKLDSLTLQKYLVFHIFWIPVGYMY